MKPTFCSCRKALRLSAIGSAIAATAALGACGGGDSGSLPPVVDTPPPPPVFSAVDVYVSHAGESSAGRVDRLDENLELLGSFDAGNNQGMALDLSGNLYIAGDMNGLPGNLRVISRVGTRSDAGAFDATTDREVPANNSTSLGGIAIAHRAGLVFAANRDGSSVDVYGSAAGESATPIASAVLANGPSDVAYDEAADRLFVAVANGSIEVIDEFVASEFSTAASRTITPASAVSLSGIAHDAAGDRLVVTDIGEASASDDGRILVIADASTASGSVSPARTISGPTSLLGDPVDIVLYRNEARVAENANDLILAYEDIFAGVGGDIAADLVVASEKPRSLALESVTTGPGELADVSDLDDPSQFTPTAVAAVSNPASAGSAPDLARFSPALDELQASLDSGVALENIVFSQSGDAIASFDDGSEENGGIYFLNRAAVARDGDSASLSRDRFIRGPNTGLVSPKGLDIDDARGIVIVADNNPSSPSIRVFGAESSGDVAPVFATPLTERPWDLDYDPAADRLYVALTDGSIAVFDGYVAHAGAIAADRTIVPRHQTATGLAQAVNLHGIVHVGGETDTLIVSDIGSASLASDGRIYLISAASTADGVTDVSHKIDDGNDALAGNTLLGNPVDLAFDGVNLYVAEKSRNSLLRFDDILSAGEENVAPAATITQDAVESVAVVPDYLARKPGVF